MNLPYVFYGVEMREARCRALTLLSLNVVQVEEKEIAIGMNQLQAIPYEKGKKILLLKNGKDYSVKQP